MGVASSAEGDCYAWRSPLGRWASAELLTEEPAPDLTYGAAAGHLKDLKLSNHAATPEQSLH